MYELTVEQEQIAQENIIKVKILHAIYTLMIREKCNVAHIERVAEEVGIKESEVCKYLIDLDKSGLLRFEDERIFATNPL